MAFPFAAVLCPILWFVYRDATGVARFATSLPRVLALALGAVVGSYAAATVVATAVGPTTAASAGRLQPLLAPSNTALAVVAVVGASLGAFLVADALGVVPGWLTTVLAPLGVAVGWPVLVAVAATYAAGNALGTELPFLVQAGLVAVGIVCSVAWLFLCSSWLAPLAGDVLATGRSQSS